MSDESATDAKMKAVWAFLDESGHSSNTPFLSIAGFLGYPETWAGFDLRWNEALYRFGAPYLHMREFAHFCGAFSGWSEDRRRGLMNDLLETICGASIVPAGMVVRVTDFDDLPAQRKQRLRDPFFLCLQETIMMMTDLLRMDYDLFHERGIVFAVFSQQDEFGSFAARNWNVIKTLPGRGQWMGSLNHGDMKLVPGLQAADLIAWEIRHFYHRRDAGKGSKRRFPLERILSHQRNCLDLPTCQYLSRELLLAYRGEGLPDEARKALKERLRPEVLALYE